MKQLNTYSRPLSQDSVKKSPKVIVRFYKDDSKEYKTVHSHKIQRIYAKASLVKFTKSHLKVIYAPDTINEGFYGNPRELKQALKAFWGVRNAGL